MCLVWFHYPSAAKNEDINDDITLPFAILESTLIIIYVVNSAHIDLEL